MSKKYQESSLGTVWWIGGAVVLILVLLVWGRSASESTRSNRTNREVALTCTTDMATQFHIHPTLEIVINGEKREIPANIGIGAACMNALHTHDNSGVIHVESPEKRDFMLADFFAVWKKTYGKDQILEYKVDEKHAIRETVNGTEVQDYENTVLRDKDKIVIYYKEKK